MPSEVRMGIGLWQLLHRYFSLLLGLSECLNACSFVSVVLLDDCSAFLNGSKSVLMELDSELVHISFGNLCLGETNLDLDWNFLPERISLWSSEAKEHFIDLISTNHVVGNSQRNLEFLRVLSLDLLLDWDVENLDWEDGLVLLLIKSDVAA